MYFTDLAEVNCPYCSERISLTLDLSVAEQEYIEDCQVCCRPIVVQLQVDEAGQAQVRVRDENT